MIAKQLLGDGREFRCAPPTPLKHAVRQLLKKGETSNDKDLRRTTLED